MRAMVLKGLRRRLECVELLERQPGPGHEIVGRVDARAGGSDEMPPERLDAAIIFATVGALVP